MPQRKIAGRNSVVMLGPAAAALYTVSDIGSSFEIDQKMDVEEVVTYSEVEPLTGAKTGTIKGMLYAKFVAMNTVSFVRVTAGGTGYTSAPTVSFTGGGGTGAAATAVIDPATGQVVAVVVTNNGSGYTTVPTVAFTGGGGTGAAATAVISGYQTEWIEGLFRGVSAVGGQIFFEIRPDGSATGKPTYTGYFVPSGFKQAFPHDKGPFSFEFEGITNGWSTHALQA